MELLKSMPKISLSSAVVAGIIAAIFATGNFYESTQRYLEFMVRVPESTWVKVYFRALDQRTKELSQSTKVEPKSNLTKVRIPLQLDPPFDRLTIHFSRLQGTAVLADLKVVTGTGKNVVQILPESVHLSGSGSLSIEETTIKGRTVLGQNLNLRIDIPPEKLLSLASKALMPSILLFLQYGLLCYLLLESGRTLTRRFFPRGGAILPNVKIAPNLGRAVLQGVGVFLVILAARLWLVQTYGTDIPYWDQWEGEGVNLYIPYLDGHLSWQHWFSAHNEHRIILTRLFLFALLLANGQWDPLLQMVMNAFFPAAIGTALFLIMVPKETLRLMWGASIVLIFSLPFGFENTLWGFQIHFYLLICLSLATLWFLSNTPFGSKQWVMGSLCGVLSLFTLASGFLASVIVLALTILAGTKSKGTAKWRQIFPTIMLCLTIVGAGLLLKVHVPEHDILKAHSIGLYIRELGHILAWPIPILTPWAFIQWLPFAFFLWKYLRSNEPSRQMSFVCGIGFLVILQAVVTAYARCSGSPWLSSRYLDIFSLGVVVNLYAMTMLISDSVRRSSYIAVCTFCFVWIIANSASLTLITKNNSVHSLPSKLALLREGQDNIREYLRTKQLDQFIGDPNLELPYADATGLAIILSHQRLQTRLPQSLMANNAQGNLRPITRKLLSGNLVILIVGLVCFTIGVIPRRRVD